ncbi:iron chelate uptake ABC transporter family permease subunit [Ephemeroptericola cinctiostellae]|nr:iron chelate uptake ABC transporter family permease subunit [Ephemeroptericola cinctiostellae]
MMALNYPVLATTAGRGQTAIPAYLNAQAAHIPLIGGFASPILDKVVAYQPDLILAGGVPDANLLAQLKQIAPTVVTFRPGEPWADAFKRIAQVLNRETNAAAFMERYTAQALQIKALVAQGDSRVSIVRWSAQGPAYMLNDSFASLVLRDAGLSRPLSQQEAGAAHSLPVNMDALTQIDADWLFLGALNPNGQASELMQASMALPQFRQLNAVQTNHFVVVDGALWTGVGGPMAAMAVLADVQKHMNAGDRLSSINLKPIVQTAQNSIWFRLLAAVVVGCALAVAGSLMQTLTRNPLAEPGLLGIQAGAALLVVLAIVVWGVDSRLGFSLFAGLGSFLSCLLVLLAAKSTRRADSALRLILAGVALSATFHGLTAALLLSQPSGLDQFRFWQLGSLAALDRTALLISTPILLAAVLFAFILIKPLSVLMLGDDVAHSLGQRPALTRFLLVAVVSVLSGGAVALTGPIAFLGVLAPFIARHLMPMSLFKQFGLSALLGAVILLISDALAQIVSYPFETPVSVVLAFLGAPLMMALARWGNIWKQY